MERMATWKAGAATSGRLAACTAVAAVLTACDAAAPPDTAFLTRAERTEYRETSSHDDVVDFLAQAGAK